MFLVCFYIILMNYVVLFGFFKTKIIETTSSVGSLRNNKKSSAFTMCIAFMLFMTER